MEGLSGLYRSSYQNALNQTVYIATTQFEPTSARRAFPCFDEPAMKATFTVTVLKPAGLIALSNMPQNVSVPQSEEGVRLWTFSDSPIKLSLPLCSLSPSKLHLV